MNDMKKIITLLSSVALVVLGTMTTGCNKMEKDGPRINPDGSVTYTITAKMSTGTKALAESGANTLLKTFAVGDQIKVTYDDSNTATGEILSSDDIYNGGKAAKFAVTFGSAPTLSAGSSVKYEYPYAHSGLTGQDGTLATLASTFDYAKWEGTVASAGQLPTNTVLTNQYAIIKFTLQDKANSDTINPSAFTISDGTSMVELSSIPASTYSTNGAGVLFVAFSAAGSSKTITLNATVGGNPYALEKSGVTFSNGLFYEITANMAMVWDGDLAKITSESTEEFATATDGMTITGTLGVNKKISIADGATVTLDNASINATGSWSTGNYAGITCNGDATIILKDGTTNTVRGFYRYYPGIFVPEGSTLVIEGESLGTGSLNARSNGQGAGIGGGHEISCGNIEIQGCTVTAAGGSDAAGIGGGFHSVCGNITISGGTVTATGSYNAAGIGGGNSVTCGNITISGGTVTATGGFDAAGIGSGGAGNNCGDITISGGTVTATGGSNAAGIGSGRGGSGCKNITISGGTVTASGGSNAAGIGTGPVGLCEDITITSDVEQVSATKGSGATDSIGCSDASECGTVTIGGTMYWGPTAGDPSVYEYKNGGDTYLPTSPLIYPTPAPSAPAGAIDGLFTINGSGEQVYFSQGNLQAVCTSADADGSTQETWTWQFAEHQYDYIGGRSYGGSEDQTGNNYINGNGSVSNAGTVDLFGWSTNATYYGIHNSEESSTYSGDFRDWGNAIGSGWRTLTNAEWEWIMGPSASPTPGTNCRTSSTVNGVPNARYAKATVAGKAGLIIFPDSYTHPGDVTAPASVNTAGAAYNSNSYDATAWGKMEAAGAVFLPAAGSRSVVDTNISVQGCGVIGGYWSSVVQSDDNAYCLGFQPSDIGPSVLNPKRFGASVRLVKVAN